MQGTTDRSHIYWNLPLKPKFNDLNEVITVSDKRQNATFHRGICSPEKGKGGTHKD